MSIYEIEVEVIQIGMYSDIVLSMLKKHEKLSLNKVLVFSYLIKKEHFRLDKVYTANNTQDVVYKAISLMSGEFNEFCDNVTYILKAIHLLITNNKIRINEKFLSIINCQEDILDIYKESRFLEKAIEESKKLTDRQFMKEVVSNV